jgi:transcriptional regulator with XRE-family HTH domain
MGNSSEKPDNIQNSPVHPMRAAREANGLSMRRLVARAGLPSSSLRQVVRWEQGEHIPSLIYANILAPHLGISSGEALREACLRWKVQTESS